MNDNNIRPEEGSADAAPRRQESRSYRILVAEDDPAIRFLMTTLLVNSGYHVDSAEDGAIAWEALLSRPYDLLITDHHMPKKTGVELVKHLHSSRMVLPVVMVSGDMLESDSGGKSSQPIAAMLTKPFAQAELLETVANVLRRAHISHG